MLELESEYLQIVKDILRRRLPGREVRAFGSRVGGTVKPTSDLDIAIMGRSRVEQEVMAQLAYDFSESDLPFRVDIVNMASVDTEFRDEVMRQTEVIQSADST